MPKVRFHGPIAGMSGAMGEIVFADHGDMTVAYMKPHYTPSEAQLQNQVRFGEAAVYAKAALADPAKREFYEMVSKERDIPLNALVIGDYLSVPSFKPLDLSLYQGKVGDSILIQAVDYIGLASVDVELLSSDGLRLEKGKAFETAFRTGYWVYMAQTTLLAGTPITIRLSGVDHTGRKAERSETLVVGGQA